MNTRYFKQNLVAGLVVMAVGIAAFVLTFGMPGHAPIFPRVASSLLFILGALLAIGSGMSIRRGEQTDKKPVSFASYVNPLYTTMIIVAYVIAINLAGFYTATALMMVVYMYHLGVRSAKTIVVVTAIVTVLVYFVFTMQLDVPLPRGFLL